MPKTSDPIDLLTAAEAAELLRVPPDTLRRWRSQRSGPPGIRLGRRVVYVRADCLAWVEEQKRQQHPELTA